MRHVSITAGFMCLFAAGQTAEAADRIEATYDFVLKGLLVSTAETVAELGPNDYQIDIDFRMRGLARLFASGHSEITATGRLGDSGSIIAEQFRSVGRWDGDDFARTMQFDDKGKLKDQTLDWPDKWREEFRYEPVPEDMRIGPDPASVAIAFLKEPIPLGAGDITKTFRFFDGDSVIEWKLTCADKMVDLEKVKRSPLFGEARECTFQSELLAGALIETDKQREKREKREAKEAKKREKLEARGEEPEDSDVPRIWLQEIPGSAYLLPIRAEVPTDMGMVRMYLKDVSLAEPVTLSR